MARAGSLIAKGINGCFVIAALLPLLPIRLLLVCVPVTDHQGP